MLKLLFIAVILYIGYRIFIKPKSLESGGNATIESTDTQDISDDDDFIEYEEIE